MEFSRWLCTCGRKQTRPFSKFGRAAALCAFDSHQRRPDPLLDLRVKAELPGSDEPLLTFVPVGELVTILEAPAEQNIVLNSRS